MIETYCRTVLLKHTIKIEKKSNEANKIKRNFAVQIVVVQEINALYDFNPASDRPECLKYIQIRNNAFRTIKLSNILMIIFSCKNSIFITGCNHTSFTKLAASLSEILI